LKQQGRAVLQDGLFLQTKDDMGPWRSKSTGYTNICFAAILAAILESGLCKLLPVEKLDSLTSIL